MLGFDRRGRVHYPAQCMSTSTSTVTRQNQISVPAAVRRRFGIHPGTVLEWHDEDGELTIRPRTYSLKELRARLRELVGGRRRGLDELKSAKEQAVIHRHRRARS